MRVVLLFFFLSGLVQAQDSSSYAIINFVRVKNNNSAEALYFYNNNWLDFRKGVKQNKGIKSYQLLDYTEDKEAPFDIILITEYKDTHQLEKSEESFQPVMKNLRPDGPLFLNGKQPGDFRENSYVIKTEVKESVTHSKVVSEIIDILKKTEEFSNAYMNKDYAKLASSYTLDAKILPPGADIITGREAIKKRWILPLGIQIRVHKITPTEINLLGNLAYDIGYYEGITIKKDASEVSWKGKYLIVWKKEDGDWKIYADAWNRMD
jgi:ketosteroid isomerase-like protein